MKHSKTYKLFIKKHSLRVYFGRKLTDNIAIRVQRLNQIIIRKRFARECNKRWSHGRRCTK